MGRFSRMIRGFFGRFVSGIEQNRPEIMLENAVADELNNLKKLQAAAARTMAYEKMLSDDLTEKQKLVAARERQARELASRGDRETAVEALQQKQEAESGLEELEGRLEEAQRNSEEMREAFQEQERRYNDVVRERSALMEERQRAEAMRAANEARSNLSLSDSSRDLEKARQAIRQSAYEAEAVGELDSRQSSGERKLSNAESEIRRFEAERELEEMEAQMGLRGPRELEGYDEDDREEEG